MSRLRGRTFCSCIVCVTQGLVTFGVFVHTVVEPDDKDTLPEDAYHGKAGIQATT